MYKLKNIILSRITLCVIAFVVGSVSATVIIGYYGEPNTALKRYSVFSFKGADGWRMMPLLDTNSPDDTKRLLLLDDNEVCTILLLERTGTIDVSKKIADQQAVAKSYEGESTPLELKQLMMRINGSSKGYELHQFEKRSGAGLSYGYIPLSSTYIDINANCKTSDKLPSIVDALETVEYKSV